MTGSERSMILLLVIGMILIIVLGTTGTLSPWFSFLVLAAGAWVLILQVRQQHTILVGLNNRKKELQADDAMALRHIGGLKLPFETPVNVFIWADHLRLESDALCKDLRKDQHPFLILLTEANRSQILEQIQPPPDDPAGLRVLSELKERIRRNDRSIRANRIILLLYRDEQQKPSSAVFLTNLRKSCVKRILASARFDEYQTDT